MLSNSALIGAMYIGQFPEHIKICMVDAVRELGPEAISVSAHIHENAVGGVPLMGFIPNYSQPAYHADLMRGLQCWLRDAMLATWDLDKIKLVLQRVAGIPDAYADIIARRIWTPDKGISEFATAFVRDLPNIPLTNLDDILKNKFASMLSGVTTLMLPELATENTDNLYQCRKLGKEIGELYDRALDMAFQDMYTGRGSQPPKDASGGIDWSKMQQMATAVLPAVLGGVGRLIGASTARAAGAAAGGALLQGSARPIGLLPSSTASGVAASAGNFVTAGDLSGYDEGDLSVAEGQAMLGDLAIPLETILTSARGGEIHPEAVRSAIMKVATHPGMDPEVGDFLSDAAGLLGGVFGGPAGARAASGAAGFISGLFGKKKKPATSGGASVNGGDEARTLAREASALARQTLTGQQKLTQQLSELMALHSGQYKKIMHQLGLNRAALIPSRGSGPAQTSTEGATASPKETDAVARALTS